MNVGAVAVEQERAIAEAQGQLVLAKKFPRDENASYDMLMRSCKSIAFANTAFYTVPNRGSGPSIRFAEEVARVYGNFQYGHRELSRSDGKSEIEVYAWDMQNNNYSKRQITVLHVVDTKNGPKVLRDQGDIDNRIANVASKQVRGRILALMPKWFVEEAIQMCRETLAGKTDEPIDARIRKMQQAFLKYGVSSDHLEKFVGKPMAEFMVDDIVDLTGVFNALKEGAKPSDYFTHDDTEVTNAASAITQQAKTAAKAQQETPAPKAKAAPKAAVAKQPDPEPEQSKPVKEEGKPVKESTPETDQIEPTNESPADQVDTGTEDDLF